MKNFSRGRNKSEAQKIKETESGITFSQYNTISLEYIHSKGDKEEYKMILNFYDEEDDSIEALMMPNFMCSMGGTTTQVVPRDILGKIDKLFEAELYHRQKEWMDMYYCQEITINDIEKLTRPEGLLEGLTMVEQAKKIKTRKNAIQLSVTNGMNRIKKKLTTEEFIKVKWVYKVR